MRSRTNAEVDAILRQADYNIRRPRPGDMVPVAKYNWDCNWTDFGLKDAITDEWIIRVGVAHPLRDLETFARYLDGLASVVRHKAKEEDTPHRSG